VSAPLSLVASLASELGDFDGDALDRGLAALAVPVAGLAAFGHPVRAGALRRVRARLN
jgi:hypothetical protein